LSDPREGFKIPKGIGMKNAFGFQFFPKGVGSIEFLFSTILMIVVFVRMRTQGARFGVCKPSWKEYDKC